MKKFNKIFDNGLCLGCGLCAAVDSDCRMELKQDGLYHPEGMNSEKSKRIIEKICPSINVCNEQGKNISIWGNLEFVAKAWADDSEVRYKSSSGGVTSALCIFLLETKKVDAILQVRVDDENFLHNSLHISRTRENVLMCNASRYAPALVFDNIAKILECCGDTFAFVGKPCDIAGIKNFLNEFPRFKGRVKYFLSIFCAGMPNYNASYEVIKTFKKESKPVSLRYRGDGWPGYFMVNFEDGSSDRMTYSESWGKILGKRLSFRCKVCPDGIGLLADIASGDAWNTKNGYPDFTESEGKNFCFIRTPMGKNIFNEAVELGFIKRETIKVDDIQFMQAYQYDRRQYVGWRIAIVQLLTNGLLNFKGLGLKLLSAKVNPKRVITEAIGTIKRLHKVRKNTLTHLGKQDG